MNRKQLKDAVINIINEVFKTNLKENVDENVLLSRYFEFTSLEVIEFIVALEEKFNFEVKPEDLNVDFFSNIKSICNYVEENSR